MTPAARVQAAIEVLDRILAGAASEQALTAWARGARYAGSKDRAAVRDHVFGVIRRRRSCAALGGGSDGRALMLGAIRADGHLPEALYTGALYAPAPLNAAELAAGEAPSGLDRLDLPDWLWPLFQDSLGQAAEATALALRDRAGVHLRVNTARVTRSKVQVALSDDGILSKPHPACDTALIVTEGARRIRQTSLFSNGLVELQDAASQALALALPLAKGARVLDYCAGGGGKTLAMGARMPLDLTAHDADPDRMRDLPARATRAGIQVRLAQTEALAQAAPFDVVLCDAPCSGSGSWRRAPDGKWALTPERLTELCALQARILEAAAPRVKPGGCLAYATCSVLADENQHQVDRFLSNHPEWYVSDQRNWPVAAQESGSDGFYLAMLTRTA